MKLAAVATVIFIAGLWPGLSRSTGPVQDAPRLHRSAVAKPVHPVHPVLVRVADLLRVRF
jgi:hypothetical protein